MASERRNAPVFVMGSPRSGTTLFYHMLLSAGDFAVYRAEAYVYNMLLPRFGDLRSESSREELMKHWLPSEKARRTGLPQEELAELVRRRVRSGGDFLSAILGRMAERQGARRWAECTPENVLYVRRIKREIPDALFIHMIRDGRDVALSLEKMGWVRPLPMDRRRGVFAAGHFWSWLVGRGRRGGREIPLDYMEVRYEDVVQNPEPVLARVASFIEHDLDYARIRAAAIGSVSQPNTSFEAEARQGEFSPVGRWQSGFTADELADFEAEVGPRLKACGYSLAAGPSATGRGASAWSGAYRSYFALKHFLKTQTPLGRRMASTQLLQDAHFFDQDRIAERRAR